MRKNTASQTICAQLNSTTDGSAVTTGTTTVYVLGDGGTQASGSGTVTHEGQGCWSYVPTQAETNYTHVAYTFVNTSAISQTVNVYPEEYNATTGRREVDVFGVSGDSTAANNLEADYDGTGYNKSASTIGTCTTNTDMRGTDSALLAASAPTNFGDLAITATTGQVTVGTNNDKTGYSISGTLTTLDALNDFDPATDTVANVTTVATVTNDVGVNEWNGVSLGTTNPLPNAAAGAAGGLPTDSTGKTSFNDITTAQVNAEVLDVLTTDTFAEPGQGTPAATASLKDKIGYIYKFLRNRKTATSSQLSVYNDDATTVDHKATISDNGTTYDEGEWASGP